MDLRLVFMFVLVVLCLADAKKKPRPRPVRKKTASNRGCSADSDIAKNISSLWTHVKLMTQPIELHLHGEGNVHCDGPEGCSFSDPHDHDSHGHHHHSHSPHKKGKKDGKHKSHKHGKGGHKHSHNHDHHDHGAHEMMYRDNHIHVHLNVVNKEQQECGSINFTPKDEFVYARCDMLPQKKKERVEGAIFMRQKPNQVLETKVRLSGFKGASKGIQDGKHDYFFDVHDKADYTNRCLSFGSHDHVHHHNGTFDHEHKHTHADHASHNHSSHASHASHAHHGHAHHGHSHHGHSHHGHSHQGHNIHDHHAHHDDWGNVVVDKKGVANMDVNCTHHQLYGPDSMLGRGLVLHDKNDKPVLCCAIVYANIDEESWEKI